MFKKTTAFNATIKLCSLISAWSFSFVSTHQRTGNCLEAQFVVKKSTLCKIHIPYFLRNVILNVILKCKPLLHLYIALTFSI